MTQKLYCYVDESGQDTHGALFIVAVVITGDQREELLNALEWIERDSGKGARKWFNTMPQRRLNYITAVLKLMRGETRMGRLAFGLKHNPVDYLFCTADVIAGALADEQDYHATVPVDALDATGAIVLGATLRRHGVSIRKVRGVRRDENDALIRLADAVCGLVRHAYDGNEEMQKLLNMATAAGLITRVALQ